MKPDNEEDDISKTLFTIFGVAVVVALIVIAVYARNHGFGLSASHSKWGEFGDFLGGVLNPLFGLLGLFALLLTISLQSRELRLTRTELANSARALQIQNVTLNNQNFENSFFQMLRLHNDIVNSIDFVRGGGSRQVVTTSGRDCFPVMVSRLKLRYDAIKEYQNEEERIITAYTDLYEDLQVELGHYFRYLYNIFKFLNSSVLPNERFYSNLVRAQISNHELVILFYNCISKYGRQKFYPLAVKYALFNNLPKTLLIDPSHEEYFPVEAYIQLPNSEIDHQLG